MSVEELTEMLNEAYEIDNLPAIEALENALKKRKETGEYDA